MSIEFLGGKAVLSVSKESKDIYVDSKTIPHPLGFYHFNPEIESDKKASLRLVNAMIQRHSSEIKKLIESKACLEELREDINPFNGIGQDEMIDDPFDPQT